MALITSRHNPAIKQVRQLRERKRRQESGLFLVEGIRHVGEAVQAGAAIETICYAPELLHSEFAQKLVAEQAAGGITCLEISAQVFELLADKENPQGVLAVVRQNLTRLEELSRANFTWGAALVDPQDPGNLGAILRTLDAVGASGLLLLSSNGPDSGGVDPYHPHAVRASMGTIFWHKLVKAPFKEFAAWARENYYHVYGTSAHAQLDYRQVQAYKQPAILLLGSEREGLTPEQVQACELVVRLPMHGKATSLNLAVAAGVMLYAMLPG